MPAFTEPDQTAKYQAALHYEVGTNKDGLLVGTTGYTNARMATLPAYGRRFATRGLLLSRGELPGRFDIGAVCKEA